MPHSSLSLEGVQQVVGLLGDHIYLWLAPASACSLPQMRFLGKFRFLGDHCPNHLRVKGRSIVSLRKHIVILGSPVTARVAAGVHASLPLVKPSRLPVAISVATFTDLTHFSALWLAECNLLSGLPDVY